MPGYGRVMFDADSLMALLTHYTDGVIPNKVDVKSISSSQWLNGWIGIDCEAIWPDSWVAPSRQGLEPLHIRYRGDRVEVFDEKGHPAKRRRAPDAPKRQ